MNLESRQKMKILYYDCFAGISGDMNLGAMIDLGVSEEKLVSELSKLGLAGEYTLVINRKEKMGITGTKVDVIVTAETHSHDHGHDHDHHHDHESHGHDAHSHTHEVCDHSHDHAHHDHDHSHDDHGHSHDLLRNYTEIVELINNSGLDEKVKHDSIQMFKLLAIAEGKVHGKPMEEVHFHEVGAIDSIVDIVGAAICMAELDVDEVISAPIETGSGFVRCAHGLMPVPAPATAELLKGVPIRSFVKKNEMTTPTGAVIIKYYAKDFTEDKTFTIQKTGYGLGTRDLTQLPNVLRAFIAEKKYTSKQQWVIEANIDDMSAEYLVYAEEKLFAAGALDVFLTPIIMKKGRPATKLSILVRAEDIGIIEEVLFIETTTIGFRRYPVEKRMLERSFEDVMTPYGKVTLKKAFLNGKCVNIKPEYEQCRALALENDLTMSELMQALAPFLDKKSSH